MYNTWSLNLQDCVFLSIRVSLICACVSFLLRFALFYVLRTAAFKLQINLYACQILERWGLHFHIHMRSTRFSLLGLEHGYCIARLEGSRSFYPHA